MLISAKRIKLFSSKARDDLVQALVQNWAQAEAVGLNKSLRVQHFMAQIATETGGLKRLDENLNYTAAVLLATFPTHVTPALAQKLAGNPRAIANRVYADRLGNGSEASGDGWTYRGSGFIQLTGRANFRARGAALQLPLEQNPELVRTPEPGFKAALSYWNAVKANVAADANDITRVRKLVNGGKNGLADAKIWFARAQSIFSDVESPPGTGVGEIEAVQERLAELGYPSAVGATEGLPVSEALKAFQRDVGLPATGAYDDETLDALTDRPIPKDFSDGK